MFVTAGRAALAGLLSLLWLAATRAPRPRRDQAATFAVCAGGIVIGFPLFVALALRDTPSMHAAVVTGVLPLATAVFAAVVRRQRPSRGFWASAVLGCALVLGFAAWNGGGRVSMADGWLLLAVASAAAGYVASARLGESMRAEAVICWVLVACLPLSLPLTLARWPAGEVAPSAWFGFAYVALFSMWLGFFAWIRGLALGGTVRVSQVQLLQPFLALIAAVPILGEPLDGATLVFALAIVGVVFVGRRQPVESRSLR